MITLARVVTVIARAVTAWAWAVVIIAVAVIVFTASLRYAYQQDYQCQEVPKLAAQLRFIKERCESRVTNAIGHFQSRKKDNSTLPVETRVRQSYGDVQAKQNAIVEFLRTGLATGFKGDAADHLKNELAFLQRQADDFVHDVDSLGNPGKQNNSVQNSATSVDVDFSGILEFSRYLLDRDDRKNEKITEMLRSDLEKCTMKTWESVGN